jgi:hypothetical protein
VGRSKPIACLVALLVAIGAACAAPSFGGAPANDGHGGSGRAAGRDRAHASRPQVLVYGDSLTWESQRYIPAIAAAQNVALTQHSFVGTAVCDWLQDMWARIPAEKPSIVVFAFYGNSWTPCMQDAQGVAYQGAAKAAVYDRDASAASAIALANGAKVVFVGAPRSREQMSDDGWERVRDVYRRIVRRHPGDVFFRDAGDTIAPNDTYTETQPCLARERALVDRDGTKACRNGRIIVRSSDGVHFCPHGLDARNGQPGNCPLYMSGGYRFISALVAAAREVADLHATTLPGRAGAPKRLAVSAA